MWVTLTLSKKTTYIPTLHTALLFFKNNKNQMIIKNVYNTGDFHVMTTHTLHTALVSFSDQMRTGAFIVA